MVAQSRFVSPSFCLDDMVIQTPCPMDWERMDGDQRQRFCSRCEKQVYNIAGMTRQEALDLIGEGDRNVCARIYRRPDGTIVTRECAPLQLRVAGQRRGRRLQFSLATLVALLTSCAAVFAATPWIGEKIEPYVTRWFGGEELSPATGDLVVLGQVVAPTANAPTACGPTAE